MNNGNVMEGLDPYINDNFYSLENIPKCNYFSTDEYLKIDLNRCFSVFNFNIRSFNRNFPSLTSFLEPNNMPGVLCLTETRFSCTNYVEISSYTGYHMTRDRVNPSGGVCLYVKFNFQSSKIDDLSVSNNTIEVCTVNVKCNGMDFF